MIKACFVVHWTDTVIKPIDHTGGRLYLFVVYLILSNFSLPSNSITLQKLVAKAISLISRVMDIMTTACMFLWVSHAIGITIGKSQSTSKPV